jgi:hypothetical protein
MTSSMRRRLACGIGGVVALARDPSIPSAPRRGGHGADQTICGLLSLSQSSGMAIRDVPSLSRVGSPRSTALRHCALASRPPKKAHRTYCCLVPARLPSIVSFFFSAARGIGTAASPDVQLRGGRRDRIAGSACVDPFGLAADREVDSGHQLRVAADMAGQVRIAGRARADDRGPPSGLGWHDWRSITSPDFRWSAIGLW